MALTRSNVGIYMYVHIYIRKLKQLPSTSLLIGCFVHIHIYYSRWQKKVGWIVLFHYVITQYGSTVYIGIAMVYPHWKPYIRFIITFTFSLLPTQLLLTWMCGYTWKLNVIMKWYNLIDDKGVKLTKVHFVNSPSSSSSSSSSSA